MEQPQRQPGRERPVSFIGLLIGVLILSLLIGGMLLLPYILHVKTSHEPPTASAGRAEPPERPASSEDTD